MISVRAARADEAAVLAEVHRQAFDDPWTGEEIATLIVGLGAFALVADLDGAVAGFILCRVAADESEVLTLATRPHARRMGVGSALLVMAKTAALAGGAATLFLEVAEDNPAALALYRGHGFRQVGARALYYFRKTGAVAALIMRADLNRCD